MAHRLKVIALTLLAAGLSLAQTPAPTSQGPTTSSATQNQTTAAVPMVGRLEVHRGRTVKVDNNDLEEGSTILDGQTLETSDCVSATVHLLPVGFVSPSVVEVGRIDIATNSKVVIHYSAGDISPALERGCTRVQNALTIDSSISTPDGKVILSVNGSGLQWKIVEVCYPSNRRESYEPVCIPPIVWVWGGASAAAVVTAVAIVPRGDNPSPELPGTP